MATTTKILATASKYGNTGNNNYTNAGSIFVGKQDGGSTYRSRLTFPSIRSLAAIGDANIVITKVTLHINRRGEGPTTVTAGSSADGAWGAATDGSGSEYIEAESRWHTIDITDCAQTILDYPGTWYLHLTGSGKRLFAAGVSSNWPPYINVVWEYAANTLTTDAESVELGKEVHLNIASEANDASYALTYQFGDESGTIAETSDTAITWTPPLLLAAELPNADSGAVKITMKVYDADGKQLRTEVLYLTVTVPETAVPVITDVNISLVNALGNYALTGKTYALVAPTIDLNGTYGATIKSVKAVVEDGGYSQNITWDALDETDAGVFTGAAMPTNILYNAGLTLVKTTVTDSRGREVERVRLINVQAYANPLITAFSVERYEPVYSADEQIIGYAPSDTGENVWVTLKASCSDVEGQNAIAWTITAKTADGETTFSGVGSGTMIDISNDRSIITAVVSAASAVEYTVAVADTAGYVAYQYDSVTPGRANFALAGSKYGASFGCLPKGTEEKPMLESAYPIYAYAGIEGVSNYTYDEIDTGGKWIDGKPIYRNMVTFQATAVNTWYRSSTVKEIGNVANIIKIDYVMESSQHVLNGMFYYSSSQQARLYTERTTANADTIQVIYWTDNKAELGTVTAIIYYTKTTD